MQRTKSQVPNLVPDLSEMDGEWCGRNLLAAEGSAGLPEPGKARGEDSRRALTCCEGPEPAVPEHREPVDGGPLGVLLRFSPGLV